MVPCVMFRPMETRMATALDELCIKKMAGLINWAAGWEWGPWDTRYDAGVILENDEGLCVGAAWYRAKMMKPNHPMKAQRRSYVAVQPRFEGRGCGKRLLCG